MQLHFNQKIKLEKFISVSKALPKTGLWRNKTWKQSFLQEVSVPDLGH